MISGPIAKVGSQVDKDGTYVTIIKKINKTVIKGKSAFTTCDRLIPVIHEVTNKLSPIGGVIIPISIFTTIMIPK